MADGNLLCAGHDFAERAGEPGDIFFAGVETDMKKRMKNSRLFEISGSRTAVPLACVVAFLICSTQQSFAQLQITSPTQGTIVNPGQTLSVTVASPTNATFTNVGVVADDPILPRILRLLTATSR